MKSGNLNFLEPSGPLQACNWTPLPLPQTASVLHRLSDLSRWFHDCVKVLKNAMGRIAPSEFGTVSKQDLMLLMAGSQYYIKYICVCLDADWVTAVCSANAAGIFVAVLVVCTVVIEHSISGLKDAAHLNAVLELVQKAGQLAHSSSNCWKCSSCVCLQLDPFCCCTTHLSLFVIRGCTCGWKKNSVFLLKFPLLTTSASTNRWYNHRS